MRAENRKILLFLDNFSGHSSNKVNIILIFIMKNSIGRFTKIFIFYQGQEPYTLTNIRLEYFVANTTSRCQPADQGIIQNAKVHYRRLLNILNKIEKN